MLHLLAVARVLLLLHLPLPMLLLRQRCCDLLVPHLHVLCLGTIVPQLLSERVHLCLQSMRLQGIGVHLQARCCHLLELRRELPDRLQIIELALCLVLQSQNCYLSATAVRCSLVQLVVKPVASTT